MNLLLYVLIFISKVIENSLATLRLIVVANGKKWLGAILQGLVALVWVCVTGIVVVNISKDPLKIVAFALGSATGSIIGSIIEEKMALGNNMIMAIIDSVLEDIITKTLRDKGYAVTVTKGNGKDKMRSILIIMVSRKKRPEVVNIIKEIDAEAMIIAENAFTIHGGHENNKTKI